MFRTERIFKACLLAIVATIASIGTAADKPTLDELKAAGALQSNFRNKDAKPVFQKTPEPALKRFHSEILPILKKHCVTCHGPEKTKARLRIDQLDPNLLTGSDVEWWVEVMGAMGNGEMPPPEDSKLPDTDRDKIMDWLSNGIRMASTTRRATGGYSSFRRMTRYEYNYALQDLLGIRGNFSRDLPPESHSDDGFQNSSETLHMTVTQLQTYRSIAREALLRATVRGKQPPVIHWGVTMKQASKVDWKKMTDKLEKATASSKVQSDENKPKPIPAEFKKAHSNTYFKDPSSGLTASHSWSYRRASYANKPTADLPEVPKSFERHAIIPQRRYLMIELGEKVPDEGTLRVRVLASKTSKESRAPSLRLEFGFQSSNEGKARVPVGGDDRSITAAPDKPEFIEWHVALEDIYPRNSVRKTSRLGSMPNPSEYIRLVNNSASSGNIRIDYVEVSAPVYEQWPPASHKQIFANSSNKENEPTYAKEILTSFMTRAWRRPISAEEVSQKLKLFHTMRQSCDTFEDAVVETLATVLSSPDFLYLVRNDTALESSEQKPLTEHELATRLAMFLWCSVPDERLLTLADKMQLSQPHVLLKEVERMLADSRSHRFAEHFVHQWLDMQLLDYLQPKRNEDPLIKEAMLKEPILFFQEVLRGNESILNFIHADYTVANERLAYHYGLTGVYGNHFRRVKLDTDFKRGGLLTQAGLLAMNSSGDDSHPLKRGIWMLESLLNDPPPPPPPAVPEIDLADPRIAKMTLKERIEDHRNHPACMSCHKKIDPWGIAFENYDATGRWRDNIKGKSVDASSRLFNNEPLNGMDGLKRFLLKNRQDQFIQAVTHKMMVYALGRPLTFSDRAGVEEIAGRVRREGDGLTTLVKQIVTSELFRSK